jgi:3-hydroxyacyl-CoA dehydrogenase/enoyl-CoA hydratase/3-hydroxybutyryl-CoA epimerase
MSAAPAPSWFLQIEADGLAVLTFDKAGASANVLSGAMLLELERHVATLEAAPPAGLIVRSGKPNGFIAGADVKEFTTLTDAESALQLVSLGQRVFTRIAALPCPSVAAIHGFALGGGLELALACRYRVAVADDTLALGLPEIQLGIHPGFGGTVRAVRLLGVRPAMDLMLTGRTIRAERALKSGLVDRVVGERAGLDAAARDLLRRAPPPRRPPLAERLLGLPIVRGMVRKALLAQVGKKAPRAHYPAPYALIDLWYAHGAREPEGYAAEARSIAQLVTSPTARNLVRVFMLQDRLKALGGDAGARPLATRVHVVGAGVMGGDIAMWCALRGLDVTLQDRSAEIVQPAIVRGRALFEKRLKDPARSAAAAARLHTDVAGAGVANADVVIEAIYEDADAKRALYARLEPALQPAALLATNTSSIVLEPLAQQLAAPHRFVGLHFFNPVVQMPLVEVVHGAATDAATVAAATAFVRQIDKLPLPCRSSPGFLVNRVLVPYLFEAMHAAESGIALAAIDAAATDFGMPVGPVELADVVGLDVCSHVGEIVAAALGRKPPDLGRLRELLAARKFGRKSGEGFYVWRDGQAVKPPVVGAAAPADLSERLILALLNECAACLREGIVDDADLVDAGTIFGAGFAPFRGGPLNYARERGFTVIRARLLELASVHGSRFEPDPGWDALAAGTLRFGAA